MAIETPHGTLTFRPEQPEDEAFRHKLFAQSRPDLDLLPEQMRAGIIAMQFRAQVLGYRSQFPLATYHIVERDGEPAGRVVQDKSDGTLHLIDIALSSELRNCGLGTAILRTLMDDAKASGMKMILSVADGNPAARLYQRLGFVAVARHELDTVMEWSAQA